MNIVPYLFQVCLCTFLAVSSFQQRRVILHLDFTDEFCLTQYHKSIFGIAGISASAPYRLHSGNKLRDLTASFYNLMDLTADDDTICIRLRQLELDSLEAFSSFGFRVGKRDWNMYDKIQYQISSILPKCQLRVEYFEH